MLQIGSLKLRNWLIMAPMAGITNLAFRLIVKKLGAGLVTSEMISAMGITRGHQKTLDYLISNPAERPFSVQLFGSDPNILTQATRIVIDAGADLVDINMGCPVKKVVKTGGGAALLRNPFLVAEIVSKVRSVCATPLTVKIRKGWSPSQSNLFEIPGIIQDNGADALTIHGRFATQGFSGQADWNFIGECKSRLSIPVIGNGDITCPAMAIQLKKQYNVDGIMIARGAQSNPWIFKQILDLEQGRPEPVVTLAQRKDLIREHFSLLADMAGESHAAHIIRGPLLMYTKGMPHSSQFRNEIARIKNKETLVQAITNFFDHMETEQPS